MINILKKNLVFSQLPPWPMKVSCGGKVTQIQIFSRGWKPARAMEVAKMQLKRRLLHSEPSCAGNWTCYALLVVESKNICMIPCVNWLEVHEGKQHAAFGIGFFCGHACLLRTDNKLFEDQTFLILCLDSLSCEVLRPLWHLMSFQPARFEDDNANSNACHSYKSLTPGICLRENLQDNPISYIVNIS